MTKQELLLRWHSGLHILQLGHYTAATVYRRRHRYFGIPVVIVSSVVGTATFATLDQDPSDAVKIAVGLLSLLAAMLAGLQTFLAYGDMALQHKTAAVKAGRLRRNMQHMLIRMESIDDGLIDEEMLQLREQWDMVEEESPTLPRAIYNQASRRINMLIGDDPTVETVMRVGVEMDLRPGWRQRIPSEHTKPLNVDGVSTT